MDCKAKREKVNILKNFCFSFSINSLNNIRGFRKIGSVKNNQLISATANKTKYMVMSRDQTAGRSQIMKIENSSFERVEALKYFGKPLTNKEQIEVRECLLSFGAESFVF
jgi:hypothetical protein